MATKRKKSGELWLVTKPDTHDSQLDSDQILPKYIELKQRIELLEEEKEKNLKRLKQLEQTIQEADSKCANHLKQLSELRRLVTDLELKLERKSEQYNQAIKQLEDEKQQFSKQEEKWQIFQKDLLTTVRVANDLKTEAEEQSDLLLNENKTLSEKIASLENELSKLKVNKFMIQDLNHRGEPKSDLNSDLNYEMTNDFRDEVKSDSKDNFNSALGSHQFNNQNQNNDFNDLKGDAVVFRKTIKDELADKRIDLKRNANCFTEMNGLDKNKLIRQQSADSVFSSTTHDKHNQRGSSQSLILSNKNKISVKSLVKTIENASKTNCAANVPISKSPSFNSINLSKPDDRLFSSNGKSHAQPNGKLDHLKADHLESGKLDEHKSDYVHKIENDRLLKSTNTTASSSTRLLANNLINSKKENCPINCPINSTGSNSEQNALNNLIKDAGSIRNGLLRWCQNKTKNYDGIEISNFSSSWKDSLVICALLHSLDHTLIPFRTLDRNDKHKNFSLAFKATQSIGIQCNLNADELINDLINEERPDWSKIMAYVTSIYNHFENNNKSH